MYFLEGELALACEHNGRTAALLKALLASADSAGNLPESLTTPHVQRADIVAQALRIGVLLRAVADRRAPRQAALDQLAANLLARVHDDGAITFCEGVQPPQRNVWCAMFAEQALSWYARWRTDRRLAVNAWDLV